MRCCAPVVAVLVLHVAGCLAQVPGDGDFPPAPCGYGAALARCTVPAECIAHGGLYCKGACAAESAANCGKCGVACPGGECQAGRCVRCSRGFDGVDHLVPGAVGFRLECPRMPQGADLSVTLTGYVVIDDVQAICRASNDRCIGFDVVVDHGDTVNVPFDRCMTPGARDVNPVLMGYGTMSVPTFREGLVTAHVAVRKVTADNGKCFGRIGFDDTARLELRARHLAPASRP